MIALSARIVLEASNFSSIGIRLGKLIQKPLLALRINMRELAEEGLPCRRFNCTIEPKGFE
jgi:hypothetical protein